MNVMNRALIALTVLALGCEAASERENSQVINTNSANSANSTNNSNSANNANSVTDGPGQIWVANRGAGTVSVIDISTDAVIDTIPLTNGGEPMYVNYSAGNGVVFVGDRANDSVVIIDAETRAILNTVETGAGVFHQWALPGGDQLWVNNDVDRTTSVIDTTTYEVLATIAMPADLAAMPGIDDAMPKPHDVLVAPDGSAAFVSYLGFDGENDYVVRFDTESFEETHRVAVGIDPHLSATADNDALYVPCQGTDEVIVLRRSDLEVVTRIAIPGAHGVGMAHDGDHFYVTNLPAEGDMALFVVDTETNELVSDDGVDAPMVGKPHNVALTGDDSKVYVTHSGPDADIVSVYEVGGDGSLSSDLQSQVIVEGNPFGLGFVPVTSTNVVTREFKQLYLDVAALTTLRAGHHYEGWAIIEGQPVSTGKFNVDASGAATDLDGIAIADGVFNAGRDLSVAEAFVITIEPAGDIDIVPNETHYLAGELNGTASTLTVGHPAAINTDFADAEGRFILATPTDGAENNETSGVWFIDLQMAEPQAGLVLPVLADGWVYEGWAVIGGTPVSTGTVPER